jgi:hypothetical protein
MDFGLKLVLNVSRLSILSTCPKKVIDWMDGTSYADAVAGMTSRT